MNTQKGGSGLSEEIRGNTSGTDNEAILEVMRRSLRKNQWNHLDLGKPENYQTPAIAARWKEERNAWVGRKPAPQEADVRGQITPSTIPDELTNTERRGVRRTFKSLQGPYK